MPGCADYFISQAGLILSAGSCVSAFSIMIWKCQRYQCLLPFRYTFVCWRVRFSLRFCQQTGKSKGDKRLFLSGKPWVTSLSFYSLCRSDPASTERREANTIHTTTDAEGWIQCSSISAYVKEDQYLESSGSVWKSRWPSLWAFRPNETYGFRGHLGLSLSLICQQTSEDIKQHNNSGSSN